MILNPYFSTIVCFKKAKTMAAVKVYKLYCRRLTDEFKIAPKNKGSF